MKRRPYTSSVFFTSPFFLSDWSVRKLGICYGQFARYLLVGAEKIFASFFWCYRMVTLIVLWGRLSNAVLFVCHYNEWQGNDESIMSYIFFFIRFFSHFSHTPNNYVSKPKTIIVFFSHSYFKFGCRDRTDLDILMCWWWIWEVEYLHTRTAL